MECFSIWLSVRGRKKFLIITADGIMARPGRPHQSLETIDEQGLHTGARSRHDQLARDSVRPRRQARPHSAARIRAALPAARMGRAPPRRYMVLSIERGPARAGRIEQRGPIRSRRSASPTSARPLSSGTARRASRFTTPSCGNAGARLTTCDQLRRAGLAD